MKSNNHLFNTFQLTSSLTLKNKIIMAPLTRTMAPNQVPTEKMAKYYARRADAGLIISEGVAIRPDSLAYPDVPGMFKQSHIDGWKNVTDRVHKNNGKIFAQIWHAGRVSHPSYLNGELPISPSETEMTGLVRRNKNGLRHGKSRAVNLSEIKQLQQDYLKAIENALEAGFDGIEFHAANGYLIDQFLHYDTNHRTDQYGGNPENMSRFLLEMLEMAGEKIGYDKIGIRLSPAAYLNEITPDSRDKAVFEYLLTQLNQYSIAYVHTGNFDDSVKHPVLDNQTMTDFMREYYHGNLIASGSYNLDRAAEDIENNKYDLIAIGRPFIANPDFIAKSKNNEKLVEYSETMLSELY